jgi:putative ABC transport system ATP-binding protein
MIKLRNLIMTYHDNGIIIEALKIDKIDIKDGKQVVFTGSSGSGKTTLFNLISGLILPTEGNVIINNTDITTLTEIDRDLYRANNIGYVFQDFNLFPDFTVMQNVLLPMTFSKRFEKKEMKDKAEDILKKVGMDNKASQKVKTLSGGEKQRVAIARSIVNKPKIILADEPTGNLDYKNGVKIMDLLKQIAKDERATLLVITHNHSQLDMFDEVIDVEKINKAL